MSGNPAVRAQSGQQATVRQSPGRFPIIVVPGIMGTRLQENGSLVWNPRGLEPREAGGFHSDTTRLGRAADLYPDEGVERHHNRGMHDVAMSCGAPDQQGTHRGSRYNVLSDYHALTNALQYRWDSLPAGYEPWVFCCGYDWRKSNAESATKLDSMVTHALRTTGAQKVFIVAHSMGGLVSRHFAKNTGRTRIQAMFLLGSPSLGAPEAYTMLKTGDANNWGLQNIALALDRTLPDDRDPDSRHRNARIFMRQFASMYELLPNALYCQHNANWLEFDESLAGYAVSGSGRAQFDDASDVEQVMMDIYTGITDGAWLSNRTDNFALRQTKRREVGDKVLAAIRFHRGLMSSGKCYFHPSTYFCYSVVHSTICGATVGAGELRQERQNFVQRPGLRRDLFVLPETQPRREEAGDKSVPEVSAAPRRAWSTDFREPPFRLNENGEASQTRLDVHRRFNGGDSEHAKLPGHAGVIAHIKDCISAELVASLSP